MNGLLNLKKKPKNLNDFKKIIDLKLQNHNNYYMDLIRGGVLKPLQITIVKKNGFRNYMKSIGKLGGQNKVPRLANDRKVADQLKQF